MVDCKWSKKGPENCDISHCMKSAIRGRCKVHFVTVWHSDRCIHKKISELTNLPELVQSPNILPALFDCQRTLSLLLCLSCGWISKYVCLTLIVCYFINLSELLQWKMILWKSSWNNYKGFSPIEKGIILFSIKISFEQYDRVCIFYI